MVNSLSILCILVSVLISRSGVQGRHLFALVAPVAARRSGQRRVTGGGGNVMSMFHLPAPCPVATSLVIHHTDTPGNWTRSKWHG